MPRGGACGGLGGGLVERERDNGQSTRGFPCAALLGEGCAELEKTALVVSA